jgi:hypothetical protein|tara:strand:- start:113 stop:541 length:429 start_codon:yes stop_codon:yes gene_type:complete
VANKSKDQADKIEAMMKEAHKTYKSEFVNASIDESNIKITEKIESVPTVEELTYSNRWFKSATPKQTLDWYVKWVASSMLLMGMSMRGIEGLQLYDLTISIGGVILWLWVSILWKDRALIVVNSVGLLLLVRNLINLIIQIG